MHRARVFWQSLVALALIGSLGSHLPADAAEVKGRLSAPEIDSIVRIEVRKLSRTSAAGNYGLRNDWYAGTGFVVDSAYVVTAAHTIAGASEVRVYTPLLWQRGTPLTLSGGTVTLCELNPSTDIAVLRVPTGPRGFLLSDPPRAPFRVHTFTQSDGQPWRPNDGQVAARYSPAELIKAGATRPSLGTDILVFSAPVGPGSSGAPLLTADGHVAGMIHGGLHLGSTGSNFAIPVSAIREGIASGKRRRQVGLLTTAWPQVLSSSTDMYEGLLQLHSIEREAQGDTWVSVGYTNAVGVSLAEGLASGFALSVVNRRSPRLRVAATLHYARRRSLEDEVAPGVSGQTSKQFSDWSLGVGPQLVLTEYSRASLSVGAEVGARHVSREVTTNTGSSVFAPQHITESGNPAYLGPNASLTIQLTHAARLEFHLVQWWAPAADLQGAERTVGLGVALK